MEKVTAEWLFEAARSEYIQSHPDDCCAANKQFANINQDAREAYDAMVNIVNRREQELRDEIMGLRNKLDAGRKLAAKYAAVTEYYDELICGEWTALPPQVKKGVNDVGKTILRALSPETE